MGNVYGYVRVSSIDQNEERQMIVMDENNVPKGNVYVDKQSGKGIMFKDKFLIIMMLLDMALI